MSDALQTIRKTYPLACDARELVECLFGVFETELALEPRQIIHADSICSDDLNAIEYPERAHEMLGPFQLGGLNGYPFAGLTGMSAFAHHVPENGATFVFYGPHVGITKDGRVGDSLRPGQPAPSPCCGAARAALAKLERGELREGAPDELDYQQNVLEQILLRHRQRILDAPNRMVAATEVIYDAISERIDLLASRTKYSCRHLVIMGGILINGDHDVGSFCEVRRFLYKDLKTHQATDWRDKLQLA